MKKSLFIILVIPMFIPMIIFGLIASIGEHYDSICHKFEEWCFK